MEFLFLFIGVLIGSFFIYLVLKPKLTTVYEINQEIIKQNQENAKQNEKLRTESAQLSKEHSTLIAKRDEIITSINILQKQSEEFQKQSEEFQRQVEETSNALYEKSYQFANEKMDRAAEELSKKHQEIRESAEKEYLITLKDCVESFHYQIEAKKIELNEVNEKLNDLTAKLTSAVEANKRAEELRIKQDFYRLQLSQIDVDEITRLREVAPYLRDSEPLNKVIWKVYYEKPYTDLIGRVVGTGIHTGIYKITNIENQMCYVGQAANIADRWKQHIKRGIGADAPTRNKLYPAMLELGVENFTFEIVEECDRSLLNDREDYWQEFFHAKDFGYSIK